MQSILTPEDHAELQKLLRVMQDQSVSPGERRLAMAEFDLIYEAACEKLNGIFRGVKSLTRKLGSEPKIGF